MQLVEQSMRRVPMPLIVGMSLLATLVLTASQPVGWLINRFGVTAEVAALIVSLITGGGITLLGFLYPFILPVVITVRTLIAALGTGYAIGW